MKEHIHQVQQVHFIYSLDSKKEHHGTIGPDISDLVGGQNVPAGTISIRFQCSSYTYHTSLLSHMFYPDTFRVSSVFYHNIIDVLSSQKKVSRRKDEPNFILKIHKYDLLDFCLNPTVVRRFPMTVC